MTESVTLPVWQLVLLLLLAAWAALDRLLMPSMRWYLRRNTARMLDELNTRLHIKIPPFQRTKRQVLVDRLLYDSQVQEAAETHAREHDMPRDVVMALVERYAREIVPAFNAFIYFRLGYWLARRIARLLYRVRLGFVDDASLAAVPPGASVVFVMNHRSNMDYVLVSYLAADKTTLSYAVGEWAKVWPLQTLIRAMGAYFVRRNSRDALYRRVLERYVNMATAGGVPQAMYPEGGLSRDGRLRPPKLGLLSYMLRGYQPDNDRDVVFVPVGINYDRTLEDRSLLLGAGAAANPRPLHAVLTAFGFAGRNIFRMLTKRWYRFGYACVIFGRPISLRAYLAAHGAGFETASRDQQSAVVAALGDELMKAVGAIIPVLPVALVATVFVRDPSASLDALQLKARVYELIRTLGENGARLYIPRQDQEYAITVGLRTLTLRRLVSERAGLYRAQPGELALLGYYANSIDHLLPESDRQS